MDGQICPMEWSRHRPLQYHKDRETAWVCFTGAVPPWTNMMVQMVFLDKLAKKTFNAVFIL